MPLSDAMLALIQRQADGLVREITNPKSPGSQFPHAVAERYLTDIARIAQEEAQKTNG